MRNPVQWLSVKAVVLLKMQTLSFSKIYCGELYIAHHRTQRLKHVCSDCFLSFLYFTSYFWDLYNNTTCVIAYNIDDFLHM